MPAPSWPALLRFEQQFDAALGGRADFPLSPAAPILSVFAAAPYGFALYPQESTESLVAPRLEFQFSLGAPAGPGSIAQRRTGGRTRAAAYRFSLLFRFVYDRTRLAESARGFDGALRDLFAPPAPGDIEAAAFNTTTLPWLTIVGLEEVRAIRGLVKGPEAARELDAWESTWEGIFALRPEAMPAA